MKNQYFGDINDYRKYGLLRAIQSKGEARLLVAWMLTENDGSRDGRLRSYLKDPTAWRRYDVELFTGLAALLHLPSQVTVSLIEGSMLLPRTSYYSARVPDTRQDREAWRKGLLDAASGYDLVFVDPDNGIEVPSRPIGHKGSSKYVTWAEIEGLWNIGCSLVIYQHFRRERREVFAERMESELRGRTGASFTAAIRTPHVLFLLAAQERHEPDLREAVFALPFRWATEVEPMRLANKPLQPTACDSG